MSGLLDFLNTPESRMGIGLLAAAGPRADGAGVGQRIAEAMQMQDAYGQNQLKSKYMQGQIGEQEQQMKQRDMQMQQSIQQQAREAAFFGLGGQQAGAQGAGFLSATPGAESRQTAQGGAANATPTGDKFDEWSRQFGIPKDALVVDYLKNGGKGIAAMLEKHGTRDMQVTNGYAYDKNNLGPGFMPSLSTSQDGKTSMVRIGQDGLPLVSSPQGALNTFNSYQQAQASFKPIKVYNPATGREEYSNEGAVAQPGGGAQGGAHPAIGAQYTGPGYAGGSAQNAATEQLRIMQSELEKLPPNHPDRPAIEREMQRLGGSPQAQPMQPQQMAQGGAYAAGPSAGEVSNAAASKEYSTQTAKDQAEQRKSIMTAGFSAPSTISKYQQLGKLLDGIDGGKFTATGTNIASAMNSLGIKIDKNLPNKEAAAALGNQMALELRSPANGAGMPGAMSDADRAYLVSMIPNANQTQQGRRQMIEAQISISKRQQQVAGFARNYEKKYGRLDNGFFEQMQAWSDVNPLFNKVK